MHLPEIERCVDGAYCVKKDIADLRSNYKEHVEHGYQLGRYVDRQVQAGTGFEKSIEDVAVDTLCLPRLVKWYVKVVLYPLSLKAIFREIT